MALGPRLLPGDKRSPATNGDRPEYRRLSRGGYNVIQ